MSIFGNLFTSNKKDNKTVNESNNNIDYEVNELITAEIKNISGFDSLEITIKGNAVLYTRAECQLVIDNSLEMKSTIGGKGIVSGFVRSLSTGTFFINKISVANETSKTPMTLFGGRANETNENESTNLQILNEPKGLPNEGPNRLPNEGPNGLPNEGPNRLPNEEPEKEKSGKVSIFSILPGNMKEMVLKPGESWCIHNSAFVCSTENIEVTTGASFSGFVSGNGIFYTKISNQSTKEGKVWLNAYGGIIEKKLIENKEFKLHSGLFLAMPESIYANIKTTLASSIFSTIASGQGIFIDFSKTTPTENDILYIQTGNFDELLALFTPPSSIVIDGITEGIADADTDAGIASEDVDVDVGGMSGGKQSRKQKKEKNNSKRKNTIRKYK